MDIVETNNELEKVKKDNIRLTQENIEIKKELDAVLGNLLMLAATTKTILEFTISDEQSEAFQIALSNNMDEVVKEIQESNLEEQPHDQGN